MTLPGGIKSQCWCDCGGRRCATVPEKVLSPHISFWPSIALLFVAFIVHLFYLESLKFPSPLSRVLPIQTAVTVAEAFPTNTPIVVAFGYLRMASNGVDTSSLLGAYLAMVRRYNEENRAPGVEFSIDSTTIPCFTMTECVNLTAANAQMVEDFVAKMPTYTAILRPNFLLSTRLVDEARRIGIPVINPQDMRPATFSNISENVIQFHQRWRSQSEHLFTYMHQTERCACSAIIHDGSSVSADYGYATRIESIKKLFTDGRFPEPPALDVPSASTEAFERFFMEDTPRRRCFFVMGTSGLISQTMERLIASDWYVPENYRFYGMSTMGADSMKVNGSAHHFANTIMTHWAPPLKSPALERAYAAWLDSVNGGVDAQWMIGANEVFPLKPTFSMLQGYMVITTILEAVRDAISRSMLLVNTSMPRVSGKPLSWSAIIDSLYRAGTEVDGHWFNHLVRRCPAPPASQDNCFCNTMTANSYIYHFNTTTGAPYVVHDDQRTGMRNVADQHFPDQCGYQVSSWSYPITGLALFPVTLIAEGGFREAELLDKYRIFESTFAELTRATNYAPTPPTRALNYAAFKIDDGVDEQKLLEQYIDTIKPFVIYGTMGKRIQDPKGVLTLASSLVEMAIEDPPLVPHSEWRWDIITLRPAQADFIHALAAYLARNRRLFTSVHAIATSLAEAELVSKSFATWGFDVPVSAIVVTTSADAWNEQVFTWLSNPSSYNPFVLATSNKNRDSEVQRVAKTASQLNRGILAIACSVATSEVTSHVLEFPPASSGGDVIFGSFVREWWLPSAFDGIPPLLHQHVRSPTFHIALLSVDVAKILMARVYFDYITTAAEVLYKLSFITAHSTSFGPFSNESCTEEQIARNARDRTCQCTKGIRTTFVMSMRDFLEGVPSARTERYAWTMTTCGVLYTPYVDPMAGRSQGGASLSAGATAGVAVGSIIFVLGIIGVAIFLALTMGGRNNAKAPKDASRPFTIVFTDIQSSTALWARAPSAMSEAVDQHHRIIRRCIGRNGGYEVKTVGDCFMVAFKNVNNAVTFAIEVQLRLVEAEWNSEIDATYVELLIEAEVYDANGRFDTSDDRNKDYVNKLSAVGRGAGGRGGGGGEPRSNHYSNTIEDGYGYGYDKALKSCEAGGGGASGVLSGPPHNYSSGQQRRMSGVAVSYYSATHFNAILMNNNNNNMGDINIDHHHLHGRAMGGGGNGGGEWNNSSQQLTTVTISGPHLMSDSSGHSVSGKLFGGAVPQQQQHNKQNVATAGGGRIAQRVSNNNAAVANVDTSSLESIPISRAANNNMPNFTEKHSVPKNNNNYLLGAAVLGGVEENGSSTANLALSTPGANGGIAALVGIDALASSDMLAGDLSTGTGPHSASTKPLNTAGLVAVPTNHAAGSSNTKINNNGARATGGRHLLGAGSGGRLSPAGGEEGVSVFESAVNTSVTPVISPRYSHDGALLSAGGGELNCYHYTSGAAAAATAHLASRDVSPTNFGLAGEETTIGNSQQRNAEQQRVRAASNVKATMSVAFPVGATSDEALPEIDKRNRMRVGSFGLSRGSLAKSAAATNEIAFSAHPQTLWHGLRVRIGVHHGMGDIRKDPVTLGYDYYGTVVNTASRVEGVGHGGQILVTEDVFISLGKYTLEEGEAVAIALGPQPLRGLDEPIKLYQVLPRKLQGRSFPPLRLHIEKETEEGDTSAYTATNGTGAQNPGGENNTQYTTSSLDTEKIETFIARICSMRQYSASLSVEDLSDRYAFFTQLFSTATPKYKMSVVAKLAELWSLDKSTIAAVSGGSKASDGDKMRAMISLMAKVTKTYNVLAGGHDATQPGGAFASRKRGGPLLNRMANPENYIYSSTTDDGGSRRSRSRSSHPSRLYVTRPVGGRGQNGGGGGTNNATTGFYGGDGSVTSVVSAKQ